MQIERRNVDEKKGIVQITAPDERFYLVEGKYIPSVTYIVQYVPKGLNYMRWLASKGWDEAEAIKEAAGDKGGRVHNAINALIQGKKLKMTDQYPNADGLMAEFSVEEWEAIVAFTHWWHEAKPTAIKNEFTIASKKYGYAGTVDLLCWIDGNLWIIDFKVSQDVYLSHEAQLAAYAQALTENIPMDTPIKLAVLQVGYRRNKNKYKWNEITYDFDAFLAARKFWEREHGGDQPKQIELPLEVKL